MNKYEKKDTVPSKEELREAAWLDWLKERQTAAIKANEPIKDIFRVTVAIDVVADGTDEARAAIDELKGKGSFVYGIKGVRRLQALFKTSEEFKAVSKQGEKAK